MDINPPNPPFHLQDFLTNGTDEDLQLDIDQFIEQLHTNPAIINIAVTLRGPFYWLMDKKNLNLILAFASSSVPIALGNRALAPWIMFPGDFGEDNPRSGWKDAAGVEREAPPSEGGPDAFPEGFNYPVDFLTSLVLIYQKLLEVRQFGLAAQLAVYIAKIVRKQAIDLEALQRLLDRIAPFVV